MIINNSSQFIFVHVPKAAGSSLTKHLSKLSRYCDLEVGGTVLGEALQPEFRRRYGLSKHSSVMEIREIAGEDLWKRYFSFGFVRNPYERAFSIFNFMKRMSEQQPEAYGEMRKYGTFAEFILSDFYQTEGPDRIFNPQFFWLRRNLSSDDVGVDFVGRVEELDTCVRELVRKIGLDVKDSSWEDVPRINVSGDREKTVYDEFQDHQELEEVIFDRNDIDFRVFEFEREVIEKRTESRTPRMDSRRAWYSPHHTEDAERGPSQSKSDVLFVCGCRHSGTRTIAKWLGSSGVIALGIERYQRYWQEYLSFPKDAFSESRFFEMQPGDTWYDTLSQSHEHYMAVREMWERAVLVGDEIPELWENLESVFSTYPHARVVYSFRDPYSVALSCKAGSMDHSQNRDLSHSVLEWNESTKKILEYFNSEPPQGQRIGERCFIIKYDDFANNCSDRRGLKKFLGGNIELPDVSMDSSGPFKFLDETEKELIWTLVDKRANAEIERLLEGQKVHYSLDSFSKPGRMQWYHMPDRRDASIEYGEFRIPGCEYVFRGRPGGQQLASPYVACIGSATTFGRFVRNPFPAQLESFTGTPFVNLGVGGGRPESFLANEALTKVLQNSSFVIMEVMSARGYVSPIFEPLDPVTNLGHFKDYFGLAKFAKDDARLQMLIRKAKAKEPVFVDRVYEATFEYLTAPQRDLIRDSLIIGYSRDSSFLLEMVGKPVIALFMSRNPPAAERKDGLPRSYEQWSGAFPHFVDEVFLEFLALRGTPLVVSRSQRGFPFVVRNWLTGEPASVFSWQDDPALNTYYPSQEMHDDAFQALVQQPLIRALGNQTQ